MSPDRAWQLMDAQVTGGRIAGYTAAIRDERGAHVRVGGRTAVGTDAPPVTGETRFRIASLTKPIGGS
jgi:CubicO group peptidase (beta-lactamase class C family)